MARLVLNRTLYYCSNSFLCKLMSLFCITDSTFVPGLLKILKRLSTSTVINTIIPGRLYTANLKYSGPIHLKLTTLATEGFGKSQKILARSQSNVQEVFLSFPNENRIDPSFIEAHLKELLIKEDCIIGEIPSKP